MRLTRAIQLLLRQVPSPAYALLAIGFFLAPFNALRVRGSITWSDIFLMAAAVLTAVDLIVGRGRLWMPPALWTSVGLTIVGYGGFLLAEQGVSVHEGNVNFLTLFYTTFLIPVTVASQRVNSSAQIRALLICFLAGQILSGLILLAQVRGWLLPDFIAERLVINARRYAGLTYHPNTMGFFSAMAFTVALAFFLDSRRWLNVLMLLFALSVYAYSINQSGSRTALGSSLIAATLLVGAFVVWRNHARSARMVTAVVAGVVLGLLAMTFRGSESALDRLFGGAESAEVADEERGGLNQQLLDAFEKEPWFGNGYSLSGVHNTIYGTLGIAGAFGLFALLFREWAFLRQSLSMMVRQARRRNDFALGMGLAMSYPIWVLSCVKNFQSLERVGFICIGLMLLYSLYLRDADRQSCAS